MEQNQQPLEALLLYTARKLQEQYAGKPEEEEFARLLQAAEPEQKISATAQGE